MKPISPQRRRRFEQLMTDACRVERIGPLVEDEDGREVPSSVLVYEGRCKVQTYEAFEAKPEAGGHTFAVQRYRVDFPISAGPFNVGDVVRVKNRRRAFRIAALMDKTHLTAQRLPVDEVLA